VTQILGAAQVARLFGGNADASGLPTGRFAFGDAAPTGGNVRVESGSDGVTYVECPAQEDALQLIATLAERDAMDPQLQGLARAITANVPPRNDWSELKAIYDACKKGRADLARYGLQGGLRYLADARTGGDGSATDVFFAPTRVLAMLQRGENGFDCDDCTMFIMALVKNCGFRAGARAYGQGAVSGFEHVFPVALISKRGPWKTDDQNRVDESHVVGLDVTVPQARLGWQPPHGDVFTALLD
jgi:hypothetical protein